MSQPEFDRYAGSYEELLRDPIRDRFSGGGSGFFHLRKRDLFRQYFRRRGIDSRKLRYLDVGCGRGELLSLLRDDFFRVAGCDPSNTMLGFAEKLETRAQSNPATIPFEDAGFDFVSAVCVYHHVPPSARLDLTREVHRVLRPGGTFAVVEHNPYNPLTRLIVSRTPVDADAILLTAAEAKRWLAGAGFSFERTQYFLYLPEFLYRHGVASTEALLGRVPLGGQYAVFSRKHAH